MRTQAVLARQHLGVAAMAQTLGILARQLAHGQTNFARMIWKFNAVYNADQLADHSAPVTYELPLPDRHQLAPRDRRQLYVHSSPGHGHG